MVALQGGALYAYKHSTVRLLGGVFEGPISNSHNDIGRDETTRITFVCKHTRTLKPIAVSMKGLETTVIPPRDLQCDVLPTPLPTPSPPASPPILVYKAVALSVLLLCVILASGTVGYARLERRRAAARDAQYDKAGHLSINDEDATPYDPLLDQVLRRPAEPEPPRKRVGFRIKHADITLRREIGRGSFGVVYTACYTPPLADASECLNVAVKCFTPEENVATAQDKLMNEVMQMERCYSHKCLVQLIGVCLPDVTDAESHPAMVAWPHPHPRMACIVMRLYKMNLAEYCTYLVGTGCTERTRWHRIANCLRDVAEGMAVLHNFPRPVVHKDLKPSNVFIVDLEEGTACVGDLGLAKLLGSSGRTNHFGTLVHRAPENFEGRFVRASDVYAFGVLVYKVIMHPARPWAHLTDAELVQRVVNRNERPPLCETKAAGCPPDLVTLMRRCWQASVTERPTFVEIERVLARMVSVRVVGFLCSPGHMALHLLPEWRAMQKAVRPENLQLEPMADIDEFNHIMQTTDARVLHLAIHHHHAHAPDRPSSSHLPGSIETQADTVCIFTKPETYGHETELISVKELAALIEAHARRGCLECVVLNMCKGHQLAALLHEKGIAYVVAWSTDLEDLAGTIFTRAFYTSLKERPVDFDYAFEAAVAELRRQGYALVDPHNTSLVDGDGRLHGTSDIAAGIPLLLR